MSERTTIEPMTFPTDARGLVIEPIGADAIAYQKNVHLVVTQPGAVRGNHYHLLGTEITVILGPALVRYLEDDQVRDLEIPDGKAYRLTIPPNVPHAMKNTGNVPQIIIAFNTVVHDPANPDVVREVLIEP
jgi:UDP-2-acetamido-2,6-beta-L-arabino-hexul-4-ose reductase